MKKPNLLPERMLSFARRLVQYYDIPWRRSRRGLYSQFFGVHRLTNSQWCWWTVLDNDGLGEITREKVLSNKDLLNSIAWHFYSRPRAYRNVLQRLDRVAS